MIGQIISHYKILEKLGEGGMGIVYKAEDTKLKRSVAIKFLPKRLSVHGEERERFIHEAQAASALNHPNICVIHEIDEVNDESFIVMEYMDGVTLREWIRKKAEQSGGYRKLGMKEVIDIATQIAEGLEKAHEKGIIHRDVKSENIMVTTDGRAKIMDFGLAKLKGVSKLTKTGSTVGTIAYMSPEQVEGIETDHRTDIFSFGVVIYEMLTGYLPFRAEHETAMMYEIINVEPKSLLDQHKGIDPELDRIVMKCLEKDREERYQSMREVAVDLKRYRRDSEGKRIERKADAREVSSTSESTSSMDRSQNKRLKIGLSCLGAIILIGLGIYFFIPKTKSIDSIAVLPFINVNADSTIEYLSDGITENLINSLTQLSNLRVIPRSTAFHYKGKDIDPHEVGNRLNVRSLLTGRVIQRGNELNIQLDLIDIETESQVWGAQYNRELSDLATVQEEIVRGVSQKLKPAISGEEKTKMARGRTNNAEAFQLYLNGRYHWNKRTTESMKICVGYFEQAIEKDPTYALAYAGLADAYIVLGSRNVYSPRETFPKARVAALKALEIDNELAEAHTSLAGVLEEYDFDLSGAEREYKRAIELNPNYPTGHQWYAEYLTHVGRHNEALAEITRARELDPLSLIINSVVGWVYTYNRQYDMAIEQYRKVFEMDSTFTSAQSYFISTYERKGMNDKELAEVNRIQARQGIDRAGIEAYNRAYKSEGWKGLARLRLARLDSTSNNKYIPHSTYASNYAIAGEKEKALQELEKSIEERDVGLVFLKVNPAYDSLRSEPRFIAILKKVGLDK